MKNPNSPMARIKRALAARWCAEDYPGAEPRFQITCFARDIGVITVISAGSIILSKTLESGPPQRKRPANQTNQTEHVVVDSGRSQIITFSGAVAGGHGSNASAPKRSPGTLIKLRLLNVIETYSTAPVHAQIIDGSLGNALKGGTLIGDATPDNTFDRVSIAFRFAKDPNRDGVALPLNARALSLDGTLGLEAEKKEGFVARSAIGAAALGSHGLQKSGADSDLQSILIKALTAGLFQETGGATQVEKNRSEVLTIQPETEFYAELTDFFPGNTR